MKILVRKLSTAVFIPAVFLSAGLVQADECPLIEPSLESTWDLHSRVISVDTHVDIDPEYATASMDPGGFTNSQNDLPKMRAGGLDAVFLILYTGQDTLDDYGYAKARAMAEKKYRAITRLTRAYPDQIGLATSADEVRQLHEQGKKIALIGMENAYPLGNSVDDVALWAERGVLYVSITHIEHNQFGGSTNPHTYMGEDDNDPGFTELCKELVHSLNEHGITVVVSHVGRRTMLEATRLSSAPVIASHSGVKGVHDNLRNLDDEQLEAIAKSGGVAHMVAFRRPVGQVRPPQERRRRK